MKTIIYLLFVALMTVSGFALETTWENHFVGRIAKVAVHDIDKDGQKEIIASADEGIIAISLDGELKFLNTEFNNAETIEFMDMDSDGKDEILFANWGTIGILDDNGSKISSMHTGGWSYYHSLACDFYKDSLGNVNVVLADQTGDSSKGQNLTRYHFDSTYDWFSYDWIEPLRIYSNVQKGDIHVVDNKVYVVETVMNSINSFVERSLSDGSIVKEYNTTETITSADISENNNVAFVAQDYVDESYNHRYTLNVINLNTFQKDLNITFDMNIDRVDILGNNVVVNVLQYKYPYTGGYDRKVYLFDYSSGVLTQKFVYLFESETLNDVYPYMEDESFQIALAVDNNVLILNADGTLLNDIDFEKYAYDNVSSITYDGTNLIIGQLDIFSLSQSEEKLVYGNGNQLNDLYVGNVDADAQDEVVAYDGWRVYLYDDDGTRLWARQISTKDVTFSDIDENGLNDVVIGGSGLKAINLQNEIVWENNESERVLAIDAQDINFDGKNELAYIVYDESGDTVKIIDTNKTTLYSWDTHSPVTNIHLFEVVPYGDSYSVVVGMSYPMRYEIGETYGKYIDYKGFVSRESKASIDDYNGDGKYELLHVYKDWENNNTWNVIVSDINSSDPAGTRVEFSLGYDEIWAVEWFDHDNDGTKDILVAQNNVLALYSVNGSQIWKFDTKLDTWNDNGFKRLLVAYQNDGNHKVFTGSNSLYEFDKMGHYIDEISPSGNFMVSSSGSYANPFILSKDGQLYLGQIGIFGIDSGIVPIITDKALSLHAGWNLVALPVDITLDATSLNSKFANASHMWKYDNNEWLYYSPISENIMNVTHNTDYMTFYTLTKGEGVWIYNDINENISFAGESYDVTTLSSFMDASSGWSLLGNSEIKSTSSLESAINSLKLIWVYEGESWKVYSSDILLQNLINSSEFTTIDAIQEGQGFWMKLE